MKFSTSNFLDLLSFKVWFRQLNCSIMNLLYFYCPRIPIKYFRMLSIKVLELAKLEPRVFTHSVRFTRL